MFMRDSRRNPQSYRGLALAFFLLLCNNHSKRSEFTGDRQVWSLAGTRLGS